MNPIDKITGKRSPNAVEKGVVLRVDGQTLEGFERGTVQLSMEELANTFEVEYVADGKQPGERAMFAGDECKILVDGDVILDGYVDGTEDDDDDSLIRLTASGRSKTADLIDCSAVNAPGSWQKAKLQTIASDLCKPFGISVTVEGDQGRPFAEFSVVKGETVFDTLSRAALKRGMFAYTVGGDLVLARAGSTRTTTTLVRGDGRLISSSRSESHYARYSEYRFRGQARATDGNWGANAAQLKNVVKDEGVTRYRPLLVLAEAGDGLDLKTRAELERNQRAGRGERVRALVDGWLTDEGNAWRPNTLVRFSNPVLGVKAMMLVATVRFRFGAREPTETELELCRPEAFDVAKYPAIGRGETWT